MEKEEKGFRKLDQNLLTKLLKTDYKKLFEYLLKKEVKDKLRLEIRQDSKAIVYYKKNKILQIANDKLYVSENFGQGELDTNKEARENPESYFEKMERHIENWLSRNHRREFETQQKIARENSCSNSKYRIIDMEYSQSQRKTNLAFLKEKGIIEVKDIILKKDYNGNVMKGKKGGPIKLTPRYDLLGIEKETGAVILFEVKKGIGSLKRESGIKEHIRDFETCFRGTEKRFSSILKEDIDGIIYSKQKLGIINPFEKILINYKDIKFIFIFEPSDVNKREKEEEEDYERIFREETEGIAGTYPTIFIKPNDYILRCPT